VRVRWFLLLTVLLVAIAPAHAEPPGILVSRQLAEAEHLQPGMTVRLGVAANGSDAREFRIAGIFEPTPDPQRLGQVPREVLMQLTDLLEMTRTPDVLAGAEPVEGINIRLAKPEDARAFARAVQSAMPGVLAVPATESTPPGPFRVLERFHLAIAAVTIAAATVFLLALTIMLVDERRETVGVLRLIGLPVRRILAQVLLEGLVVASGGALFGLGLALVSQRLINGFFQWRYDTALVFVHISPTVAFTCVWIAVPLGATATVCASWALLRRNGLRLVRR
jgi:ABC-type lipoprotein release transport system permease subunit